MDLIRPLFGASLGHGIGRFAVYWFALSTAFVALAVVVLPHISLPHRSSFDASGIGIVLLSRLDVAESPILVEVEETPPKEEPEQELPPPELPRTPPPPRQDEPALRDRPPHPRLVAQRIARIEPVSAPALSPSRTPMLAPRRRPLPYSKPKTVAPDLAFQGVSGPRVDEIALPPTSASLTLSKVGALYSALPNAVDVSDLGVPNAVPPIDAMGDSSGMGAQGGGRRQLLIRGVSLASLSDCITDAQEDSLKEKLLSSVQVQVECNSGAGTFHFVETKNLNAFLMRIERNPERRPVNRCGELELALDCLTHARKEGHES